MVLRLSLRPTAMWRLFARWDLDTGDDAAENNLHLLTPCFFRSLHRVLAPGGRVVLFSDNRRYLEQLCVTASGLRAEHGAAEDDALLFTSAASTAARARGSFAVHGSVELHDGVPGEEDGHVANVTSYFDRFWEQGNHVDRVFFVLAKN